MIPIPPADPALPNFPVLFDRDTMRELLARHASLQDGVAISGCRPTYVRYKPGTSCLVAYDLDLVTGDGPITRKAHIRTFADDRGQRRMGQRKLQKLTDRATTDLGTPEMAWASYIPELNGVFSLFPVDYDLRPLVKVATVTSARKHLRRMIGDEGLTLTGEPELVRYKPGRKVLFRYDTGDGAVYGKVHADDRAGMIRAATETLVSAGLRTPRVLGTDEKLSFIAHEEVSGIQLAAMREDERYAELLGALAEPLAMLHRTCVDGLAVHHLGHEMDRLRETASLLGIILPAQGKRLEAVIRVLEDRLARVDDELATNHGDFYDDQAIVDGGRIALIDLDEIRLAHPMLDIGNMLAHLRTGEMRGSVSPEARKAFIRGMRRHREMDDRDLATFEAIGILKLAPGPFRRLEPDWPEAIDGMLELIEDVLEVRLAGADTRSTRPSPTKTPAITDDQLPELPGLQDPWRMQAALREATGDAGLVLERIHIQRHKQGRRAIIRYDIAGDMPTWGKIFASKRGPRVHEITRAICDARAFGPDVALPEPIAFLPELRVLLQRSVPGEPITPRLFAGDTAIAERIADAIHAFHTSGLDLGREHDLDKELSPLHGRVSELRDFFPHLGEIATGLHASLLDLAGTVQRWRCMPIHRDFYDAQVLGDGDRLSVLDLDDAAMSEPAIDIANFAAHLDLMALQHPDEEAGIMRPRDHFVQRSRELDPALDERLLAFLTAATMLRLAGIHAPREDGERIAEGLIRRAGAMIEVICPARI